MHLIAVIGFLIFGILAITLGIVHEYTWWRRRGWHKEGGVVVGFKEEWNDGVIYYSEVQVKNHSSGLRFFSKYGSSKKPNIGDFVDVILSESGESAEQVSGSNRVFFTLVPMVFGLILITVGLTIRPLSQEAEQNGSGQSATRSESR